ncbi:Heat shock 70 kDa protein 7, chloroplastic [Capsicum annuum]|nr:Heat shock 70 kDa protein 7, chloroplastic [Capsicum annuum]
MYFNGTQQYGGTDNSDMKACVLKVKDRVFEALSTSGDIYLGAVQNLVRKMTGKEPNVSVNRDEVVVLGASVQTLQKYQRVRVGFSDSSSAFLENLAWYGIKSWCPGDVSDIVLLDVTPFSLGLEALGGVMAKIIPRNTTLPTSKSEVFSTAADGQTSLEINIEVKFDIDANGILLVMATDKGTGKKQDITITDASTFPKNEVDGIVQEAEKFAREDKEKRDSIDTKTQAKSIPGAVAGPAGSGPTPSAGTTGASGFSGKDDGDGKVIDADFVRVFALIFLLYLSFTFS